MFYSIPPVGNRIRLCREKTAFPDKVNQFIQSLELYASGTMALASAILAVKQRCKDVALPEVILPAYACPDLISAVRYADVTPVLVDFEQNKPWMDLTLLKARINTNTIAVLAVNLYGIPERTKEIKLLLKKTNTALIEDSAQLFSIDNQTYKPEGDLIIFSFGRGKPVSILSGGAVLCQNKEYQDYFLQNKTDTSAAKISAAFKLKVFVYNLLISPYVYWLPSSMPFLKLGQTIYKPLNEVEPFKHILQPVLKCNINRYISIGSETQNAVQSMLSPFDSKLLIDLYSASGSTTRLLRYPVLAQNKSVKEKLYKSLSAWGVSRSYPEILPDIEGLAFLKVQGEFPNAKSFADRVLTFPVHTGVTARDIESIRHAILSLEKSMHRHSS